MNTDDTNVTNAAADQRGDTGGGSDEPTRKVEIAARLMGYATAARYRMRGDFLFQGVPLAGAHVLEVGCGRGAWSIWAALHGASHVVGIEPSADGSTSGSLEIFRRAIEVLSLDGNVEARPEFLQDLPKSEGRYDVITMYNVINHLDEESVTTLHYSPEARSRYVSLLEDLRSRMRARAWLIVADCARDNVWTRFGLRSPFASNIEWHKHQNPQTWIEIFREAGFRHADLRWSPMQPIPKWTANKLAQYLTCSHFVLRFQAG